MWKKFKLNLKIISPFFINFLDKIKRHCMEHLSNDVKESEIEGLHFKRIIPNTSMKENKRFLVDNSVFGVVYVNGSKYPVSQEFKSW